jgi:hypothetical protein
MNGCSANGLPISQRSNEASVISRIVASNACMRWPWNAGRREAALAQVLAAVEREQGVPAQHRLEQRRVADAGEQDLRVRGEHLLDQLGARDDDELLAAGRGQREHVAEPGVAGVAQRQRPGDPPCDLDEGGSARARRQPGGSPAAVRRQPGGSTEEVYACAFVAAPATRHSGAGEALASCRVRSSMMLLPWIMILTAILTVAVSVLLTSHAQPVKFF